MPFTSLQDLLLGIIAILIALSFHEFAHGQVASFLGDPTPKSQGRLTLNPLAHLDLLGTLLLVVAGFGWAKPVEVNPFHFRGNRQQGMMLVGAAGPVMNLLLAFAGALGMAATIGHQVYIFRFFSFVLLYNIVLAVFNLIPLPPLDGSRIVAGLLPSTARQRYYQIERYGPLILLVLVFFGVIGRILNPLVNILSNFFLQLVGLAYF